MKLTKPERIGASQLIPGVRRTRVMRTMASATLGAVVAAICALSGPEAHGSECQPSLLPSAEACTLAPSATVLRILGPSALVAEGCRHPESRAATCTMTVGDARLDYQVIPALPELRPFEHNMLRGLLKRAADRDGAQVD